MFGERPRDPYLSESENQRLTELERRLRIEDPALDRSLRSGRPHRGSIDPVMASVVALVATPIIVLVALLCGPGPGAAAAAVSVIVLLLQVRRSRRSSNGRPSAFR